MDLDRDSVRLARLASVAQRVANASQPEDSLGVVVQSMRDAFHAQTVAAVLLDEDGHLRIRVSRGLSAQFASQFRRPVGSGIVAEVVLGGMALLLPEPKSDREAYDELKLENDFGSAMAVPLTVNHRPRGYVFCDHRQPGRYTRQDLQDLNALSYLAALALEKAELGARISLLAVEDPVTDLANYSHFYSRLSREVARALRYNESLGLMVLSVANLAAIEEAYGQEAGGDVLRSVARTVRESIRGVDFAGRLGPGEMVICLVHASADAVGAVADRIAGLARETFVIPRRPAPLGEHAGLAAAPADEARERVAVMVYFGAAVAPDHARDAAVLVAKAQDAVALAKGAGAGHFAIFGK